MGNSLLLLSLIPLVLILWFFNMVIAVLGQVVLLGYCYYIFRFLYHNVNEIHDPPFLVHASIILLLIIGSHIVKLSLNKKHADARFLMAYQNKLNAMVSNISDVIGIINKDGIITYKSPGIERLFGWNQYELIGKEAWETVHPDDIPMVQEAFYSLFEEDGKTVDLKFRYRTKQGIYTRVYLSAKNMVHDENINGILLNYRDISDLERTNKALEESEKKYRSLYESISDAICIIDDKKNILVVNDEACRMFEYPREEIIRMNLRHTIHPADAIHSNGYFDKLEKDGSYKLYEGRILTRSGKMKWIQVNSTQIDLGNGKTGSMDIIRDITKRKLAEEELKSANATKDKFFSIISHDIRNPFGTITGLSELILTRLKKGEYGKVAEMAGLINETALHGEKLLTNLLDWSKSQRGKLSFMPVNFRLSDISSEVTALLQNNASQKNINLINSINPDTFIYGDKNMIKTVLRNLISNAIKFTKKGGSVTLKSETDEKEVTVSIIDTGVGIEKKDYRNLFKLESNFHTAGTNNEQGTGLGLILCREFIEKNGGLINVESEVNKGSHFYFTVPTGKSD